LKDRIGSRAPGNDLDGVIRIQVKDVIHMERKIGVGVFQGLGKRRERKIDAVFAEPDRDRFLIHIQDQELGGKPNFIFSCVVGSEQGRGQRSKSSNALDGVISDRFGRGEIGLSGRVHGDGVIG